MNVTYKDNSRRRTVQLLALAWGLYAISFSLPAINAFGTAEGWLVFLWAFWYLNGSEGVPLQITVLFFDICNLCALSSPLIFCLGRRRWSHSLSLVLGTALALGTLSWVYLAWGYVFRDHLNWGSVFSGLYSGAYIWLASMTLLAAVLFRYGRASKVAVTS